MGALRLWGEELPGDVKVNIYCVPAGHVGGQITDAQNSKFFPLLEFEYLNIEFVSDFDIRISDLTWFFYASF